MKNVFRKIFVLGVVLASLVGFMACDNKKDNVVETGYIIEGIESTYFVNDDFNAVGKTLKISFSDGTTKTVIITENMVKQSIEISTMTIGEQTLIIEYNNKEYEFEVEILDYISNFTFGGQLEWTRGSLFNPANILMTVTWASTGEEEIVQLTSDMIVSNVNINTAGNKTITVRYNGQETQFGIVVINID